MKQAMMLLVVGVVVAGASVWLGMQLERQGVFGGTGQSDQVGDTNADKPFRVSIATVEQGSIALHDELLGTIARPPDARSARMLSCDVVVEAVEAVPGERVSADTPILRVVAAPSVLAQRDAARQSLESAQRLLDETEARLKAGLATKAERLQAQQSVDAARVQLDAVQQTLPPDDWRVRAGSAGVLGVLAYNPGDLAPAGSALFSVEAERLAVRFGVPVRSAGRVQVGDTLTLTGLLGREDTAAPTGQTTLQRIEPAVDPASLTLIAWSKPVDSDQWRVGQPVRVTMRADLPPGLVLPRDVVVLSDDGPIVHAIRDGKAFWQGVKILAGNKDRVCVQCPELSAGDRVAVVGTYELQDGAAVSEAKP